MEEVQLLDAIAQSSADIIAAASAQVEREMKAITDDPRWRYPYPLRPELQLRYLYFQAMDALDISVIGLRLRTSTASIGSVRLLAECCVSVKWLTQTDKTERQKRAARSLLSAVQRTRRLEKQPSPDERRLFDEMLKELQEIAHQDGMGKLRPAPKRDYLFKTYLKPGYVIFAVLSELGSHPGFSHLTFFHQDRSTKRVNIDLSGQPGERAVWIATAFELFGYTTDEIGRAFGWDQWLQGTIMPIVEGAAPIMKEIRSRWEVRWGMDTSSIAEHTRNHIGK